MSAERKNLAQCIRRAAYGLILLTAVAGCEPPRPYRVPVPPSNPTPLPRAPQSSAPKPPPPPPPAEPEAPRRPLPQDSRIREQELKSKAPPTAPSARDTSKEPNKPAGVENHSTVEPAPAAPLAPPLPDDSSLLAKITPGISPQRAASLRLADEGKKLLDGGEPAKALTPLERSMSIDSTNPYGYFYLAKAQYRLGRYKESMNFLDVAESRLSGEPFWLAEVHALRGDNFRAQGQLQRAEVSYNYAMKLNSGNRTAAEGLARLQSESQPASR